MSSENSYENFRTVLATNLCTVLSPDQLRAALEMVDISMAGFEISRKLMEIIPTSGVPEVVKLYLASRAISNLSMKTLAQYRYKLINFFTTVRKSYQDIQTNDIRMYLYRYRVDHHASDRYLDNIRITLNSFFQWLTENDFLPRNPCAKVDKIKYIEKKRTPLSILNLESIRWNCESVREKALVDFFFSTGCRVSECADVLQEDITWEKNAVHIRHGKGGKERTVYFNDESKVSLQEYLKSRDDDNPALWVSLKAPHQQLKTRALEIIIRKVGERTGVRTYPHRLRHTFATHGLGSGMPLEELQALLGHANPQTTLIYAKLDDSRIHAGHLRAFN